MYVMVQKQQPSSYVITGKIYRVNGPPPPLEPVVVYLNDAAATIVGVGGG